MQPLPPCPPHALIRLKSTNFCAYKAHHNLFIYSLYRYAFTIKERWNKTFIYN